jgi:glycerol-3-phosphate dehydrogenase
MSETWRKSIWNSLNKRWDLIVIGGGITGAGLLRRAVSGGLETLLVEANDFSSGTSSRSSKLVHGGFRYLINKQWDVTRESVREREWLLKNAPELVTPMQFVLPYSASKGLRAEIALGVTIYDLMACKWAHRRISRQEVLKMVPEMKSDWLKGAFLYYDAAVDDSMLVNRLILESVRDGGTALNYCRAAQLLKTADGQVRGVRLEDQSGQDLGSLELQANLVVNATGPWSDKLRAQVAGEGRMRPLRGSHLVFERRNLPIPIAVTIMHPKDHRAMFAIPWEGTTIIGTTDLDHKHSLDTQEPYCSEEETAYILEVANANFPSVNLKPEDIISSFAGVRPIIHGGVDNPSGESRRHAVFEENGLITITGGKLSIFRVMAEDTMAVIERALGRKTNSMGPWFKAIPSREGTSTLDEATFRYLGGRYGADLPGMISNGKAADFEHIAGLPNVWAELKHAVKDGYIEHLDDLLLRRVRLGLLLPEGGKAELPRVKSIVEEGLGWDEHKWNQEAERYNQIYQNYYSPNPQGIQKG